MQYEKGERDMVMLQHKFEIENKDGSKVRLSISLPLSLRSLVVVYENGGRYGGD
jgi:hypothetical protein